jgi:pyroglutamyl-peptidase
MSLTSMRDNRPALVITGFGPFPGYPSNPSGLLAERLADAAARRFPAYRIRAVTLPTEWTAGPGRLGQLIEETRPAIALHFGISRRAKGFVIETRARNLAAPTSDAIGALPPDTCVVRQGPDMLTSAWPAGRIVARLRRLGLPAVLSHDAGRYLCNAILYHSLAAAGRSAPAAGSRRGFVHIPPALDDGMHRCQLDWDGAITGGLEIIAACLGGIGR